MARRSRTKNNPNADVGKGFWFFFPNLWASALSFIIEAVQLTIKVNKSFPTLGSIHSLSDKISVDRLEVKYVNK